jgi:hypothetical protein
VKNSNIANSELCHGAPLLFLLPHASCLQAVAIGMDDKACKDMPCPQWGAIHADCKPPLLLLLLLLFCLLAGCCHWHG